ncbi:MAG: tRNA (N(6)-L-threonylcarbamoyladenosine(37)-C(2))-methylthiotransferase MtaB [Deltaproteobacteria bacterium]|nr:tRNA (N(6)-L-threonylcarbamoyladenosine(37)-C(2))-methylthiotransferase MtaB [Deltaproteobacteria bacterium]
MQSKNVSLKAALTTLGCKVNQYETAAIQEALEGKGFEIVPFNAKADVYVINTCTVTAATNYQSRQLIRRAHRKNPDAAVIVTGCYAQINPGAIAAIDGVVVIAGNAEKEKLPDMIEEIVKDKTRAVPKIPPRHPLEKGEMEFSPLEKKEMDGLPFERGGMGCPPFERGGWVNLHGNAAGLMVGDIRQSRQIARMHVTHFPGHTRAFLKIQDGCDSFCSYCIVPFARGPERSLPPDAVMESVAAFAQAGHREVVLTGIHLGRYGRDLTPPATLLDILERVERRKTVERLRLSSIEAQEVSDEMIAFMAKAETLCRHLHIPLQSGDDEILALMKRNYDARFFKDLLEKLRQAIPDIAIGIDVMVGFPGEDKAAFENTRRFIEEIPVAYLHVFPYSERPGTAATALPGKVREADKKERAEILRNLGKKKRAAFGEQFIGRELTVLVERGKKINPAGMTGFSGNYIPVVILSGGDDLANQIVRAVPEYYEDGKLYARTIGIE